MIDPLRKRNGIYQQKEIVLEIESRYTMMGVIRKGRKRRGKIWKDESKGEIKEEGRTGG